MRIAHVTSRLGLAGGGIATVIDALSRSPPGRIGG